MLLIPKSAAVLANNTLRLEKFGAEMLIIFNTDEIGGHELYSALNPNLRREGDELHLLLSYTPESGLEPPESPRYALPMLKVERRGGVLCTRLALGPAGIAIYAAGRFPRIGSQGS